MKSKKMWVALTAFLVMAFAAAQADVIVLQTMPVGGNTVDWSTTGLSAGVQAHAFVGFSTYGDTATATVAGATVNKGRLIVQGTNWNGDYATGEYGIWSQSHGPITVSFGNSYSAVGAYFQPDWYGAFTVKVDFYTGSTLIGSVTTSGTSTTTPGTALFVGGLDKTGPNITKAVFSATSGTGPLSNISIGTMYLGVPEPSTMVLLGSGLIGLAGFTRRRMTK